MLSPEERAAIRRLINEERRKKLKLTSPEQAEKAVSKERGRKHRPPKMPA